MSSSKTRGAFALLVRVAVFALLFGVVAEVWFRTAMPACEWPVGYQQQPSAVARYDPGGPTSGLFTSGRLCRRGGEWLVNDAGWNSRIDYESAGERRRPLIALLGDSYIEGFLTDTDQHIDSYLPAMLPSTAAYAFGMSGWYLEQYVAVSRYAQDRFQPDVLIVFIDAGDVTDSLRADGTASPNWWQIGARGASFEEVPPTSVKPDFGKQSAIIRYPRLSAILRYVSFNALMVVPSPRVTLDRLVGRFTRPGNTPSAGTPQMEEAGAQADDSAHDLFAAADFMVSRLCSDHPGTPIVFVAHRQPSNLNGWDTSDRYLPVQDIEGTPLFRDGRAVEAACEHRAQCSFVDLRYAFSRDWSAHHVRFESADNVHWNAYANRLVARVLADVIIENGLLSGAK